MTKFGRIGVSLLLGLGLALGGLTATPAAAASFDVPCGDVAALRNAITAANATIDHDTIEITGEPCTFNVAEAVVFQPGGDTGLPAITQPLTINGNGATVQRTGATNYRLFLASTPDFAQIPRVELRDLTISSGRLTGASQNGAGLAGFLADIVLERVTLVANQTAGRGGAVALAGGSLSMDKSIASLNAAAFGGAIYSTANQTLNQVNRSSFYFNGATVNSGAMLLENGETVVENSTVAANAAPNGSGGITAFTSAAATPATVTVRSSTLGDNGVAGNTAPGTSLWTVGSVGPASITAIDTVVVDTDSADPPVSSPCLVTGTGGIASGGGNVEWPTSTCDFEIEDDPRVSYQFGGLGGVELFAKLQRDSAAIDAAGLTCPAVDQRGLPRPGGSSEACDSGSWETQPPDTFIDGPESPTAEPVMTLTSSQDGSTFECRVDGGDWEVCPSPYAPDLEDGEHTVEARAINEEGEVDPTPASVTFVVDTTEPPPPPAPQPECVLVKLTVKLFGSPITVCL